MKNHYLSDINSKPIPIMKTTKLPFLLALFLCVVFSAQAAVNLKLATHPVEDPHPIVWSEHFTNESFVKADFRTLETAIGQQLGFREKVVVKITQKAIGKELKKGKKSDLDDSYRDNNRRFSIGGFLLGFFLGLIGCLIAILFGGNAFRSSLLGLLCWIIVVIIALVI